MSETRYTIRAIAGKYGGSLSSAACDPSIKTLYGRAFADVYSVVDQLSDRGDDERGDDIDILGTH